jgi:TetR/AcrR family fatty acid metabolism transcriptional regulator
MARNQQAAGLISRLRYPANPSKFITAPSVKHPATKSSKSVTGASDKYQRILDAAIEVIADRGFFHSRVAAIAERAGVADGTVYLYFKNKDELLMAAIDSAFHRFLARARAALVDMPDAREKLRRIAFLHLEAMGSNRNLAVVFQTELRHSAKFLSQFSHKLLVEYFDLIKSVLREGQETRLFREEISVTIAAHCFFGALDEIVTTWVLSDWDRDREYQLSSLADTVVDIVMRGIAAGS